MVKKVAVKRPKWLRKDVTPKIQSLARTNVGSYLDTVWPEKKKLKTVLPLLHGFFEYLRTKDQTIKKVEPEDLATNDTTTSVIYHMLKKQWQRKKRGAAQPKSKTENISEPGPEDHNTTWMKKHPPAKESTPAANTDKPPEPEEQK